MAQVSAKRCRRRGPARHHPFSSPPHVPQDSPGCVHWVRGLRGSLKYPSVPYLPQPFSQSFPNACIIFLAEVLLLPRAPPFLALLPKYSALICSRTNLPRSRKARLPAPSSAQGGLGNVVPSLCSDPLKHPESSQGRALPSLLAWQVQLQLAHAGQYLLEEDRERTWGPREVAETTFSKMLCAGFRSALRVRTRD